MPEASLIVRYSSQLKAAEIKADSDRGARSSTLSAEDHAYGILAMDVLVEMLVNSPTNAS